MVRYRKRKNEAGRLSIACIVICLLAVMSVQIIGLYHKNQEYTAQEEELKKTLAEEEKRTADLKDYEAYINSQEGVEDLANNRLGMVYDNQKIFKAQE